MKKALFLVCLAATFLLSACQKEACIQGLVLDSKTGQPVPGVRLTLGYEYSETGSLKKKTTIVYSDQSGEFSYSAGEKNSMSIGVEAAEINGYSQVFSSDRSSGNCDEVTVKLTPLDGLLKLSVSNETGTHDTLYAEVFNKCQYLYFKYGGVSITNPYPLTLSQGGVYTKTFNTCAGDSSAVRWKFAKNDPWFRIDTVFVKTSDTVFYEIKY